MGPLIPSHPENWGEAGMSGLELMPSRGDRKPQSALLSEPGEQMQCDSFFFFKTQG